MIFMKLFSSYTLYVHKVQSRKWKLKFSSTKNLHKHIDAHLATKEREKRNE